MFRERFFFFTLSSSLLASVSVACTIDSRSTESTETTDVETAVAAQTSLPSIAPALRAKLAADFLPAPGIAGVIPWGGVNATGWKPEAIAANAASSRINAAWKDPEVADVLVAIPTKLRDSHFNPYGDGQTNSDLEFPFWSHERPPLVGILEHFRSSPTKCKIELDEAMNLAQTSIEIAYENVTTHAKKRFFVQGTKTANGKLVATFQPPAELGWDDPGQLTPIFVRPSPGYADWFPLYFRMPRHKLSDFVASVPQHMRTFPIDGKPILDPEGLAGEENGKTPLQRALLHSFPTHRYNVGQNAKPYVPSNVHAEFGAGGRPTAVGRGFTWVAEKNTPFKIMYTGFDGRDTAAETQHGVPSGSGWHVMGDTITLVNHEENVPLLAGAGFSNPATRFGIAPPDATYSYALSDVVVYRLLQPGEAFVTTPTIFPQRDQDHQWYAIPVGPRERGFLAEEWVSPTRPAGNNPKFL